MPTLPGSSAEGAAAATPLRRGRNGRLTFPRIVRMGVLNCTAPRPASAACFMGRKPHGTTKEVRMSDHNTTTPPPQKAPVAPHKGPQPTGSAPRVPTPFPNMKPAKPIPPGAPIR
jgi:hypothetical protein